MHCWLFLLFLVNSQLLLHHYGSIVAVYAQRVFFCDLDQKFVNKMHSYAKTNL